MSLAITFEEGLRSVLGFLRWLAQPEPGYPWALEHDRIFVDTERKLPLKGQPQGEPRYRVHAWLPRTLFDHPVLIQVLNLFPCQRAEAMPPPVGERKAYELEAFLESWSLQPAPPSRTIRHDLLVALYDIKREQIAGVFAGVPKNPLRPSTVVFLDRRDDSADDTPQCLFLLPQADPSDQWPIWREAENRRLLGGSGGRRKLRLFSRLPGENDFYTEYGWAHPLPEIGTLYPNSRHAQYILIAGEDRDGKRRTCWTHIRSSRGDFPIEAAPLPEGLFDLQLEDVRHALAQTVPAAERLQLRPTLVPRAAERRADLERLEKRIQAVRSSLSQMEQERAGLLARHRDRFYLLLRFHQPATPAGEVPRLAAAFQRFLLLSRLQFDQFDYVYVDRGAEGGQHVVLTRQAGFYQDLHTGLADEVFYQPAFWKDWQLDVFVRDDCELLPRIDSLDLARPLGEALRGGTWESDLRPGTRVLLLAPPAERAGGEETGMEVTALLVPHDAMLLPQLRFLNQSHPLPEVESRAAVRAQLREEMERARLSLEEEIATIEHQLAAQASARLEEVQLLWNQLAPEITRGLEAVQTCGETYVGQVEPMLRQFSTTWDVFLDRILELNHQLIASKLEALERLGRAEREWPRVLDEVRQGREDVERRTVPLANRMRTCLDEADVIARATESQVAGIRLQEQSTRGTLLDEIRKCNALLEEAQWVHRQIAATNRELEQKKGETQQLLSGVGAAVAQLEAHLTRLDGLIRDVDEGRRQGQRLVQSIDASSQVMDERLPAWQKDAAAVEQAARAVQAGHERTAREVAELEETTRLQIAEGQRLEKALEAATENLRKDVDEASRQRERIRELTEQARRDRQQLEEITEEIAKLEPALRRAEADRTGVAREIERVGGQLAATLAAVRQGCSDRLAGLVAEMTKTAHDLDDLARLEVESLPGQLFQRSVRIHADAFRRLSAEQHARIWGTTNGAKEGPR